MTKKKDKAKCDCSLDTLKLDKKDKIKFTIKKGGSKLFE